MAPIDDYQRKVTDTEYSRPKRSWWTTTYLHRQIVKTPVDFRKQIVGTDEDYPVVNDEYIVCKTLEYMTPLWGVPLLIIILFYMDSEPWDVMASIIFVLCFLLVIIFGSYFFTMPEKEQILNRKEGTITFKGFMWADNITMRFDDVRLMETGGASGVSPGPIMLGVERPDRLGTPAPFDLLSGSAYKDQSLLTWYMDRNRPLPPGSAFDPYRQKDFERCKAEGFPPPKYASFVPTPEATPEQQAEREQYWRDGYHTTADGERAWHVVKGPKLGGSL